MLISSIRINTDEGRKDRRRVLNKCNATMWNSKNFREKFSCNLKHRNIDGYGDAVKMNRTNLSPLNLIVLVRRTIDNRRGKPLTNLAGPWMNRVGRGDSVKRGVGRLSRQQTQTNRG